MSDQSIAAIARNLADALLNRARSRSDEDKKAVLRLQMELVNEAVGEEIAAEKINAS
jgi:hypothetical protein